MALLVMLVWPVAMPDEKFHASANETNLMGYIGMGGFIEDIRTVPASERHPK